MSQSPQPPQPTPGPQPGGPAPYQQPGPVPPPTMYAPPPRPIPTEREVNERQRILMYSLLFIVAVLVVGLIAGILDAVIRNRDNYFILNVEDVLLIIASVAPWIVLFFIMSMAWVIFANRLFVRWNTALSQGEHDEAHGKGVIYEIVRDNNAAAALVLILPIMIIALALIFIVILIKP